MKAVGMTVGGFYRHFPSKEALVAEAIDAAALETTSRHERVLRTKGGDEAASDLLRGYLSMLHRDHPELGCPVAALCSEIAHEGPEAKDAFTRAVASLLAIVQTVAPGSSKLASDRRLQIAAAMVGAVVLARATSDDALAAKLLDAVRRQLAPASGSRSSG
jgi:AcrR family transcriptional regulator